MDGFFAGKSHEWMMTGGTPILENLVPASHIVFMDGMISAIKTVIARI